MMDSDLCEDVWTIRKLENDDCGDDRRHLNDLDDNDEEYFENKTNWKVHENRKKSFDNSWNQYQNYEGLLVSIFEIVIFLINFSEWFSKK